MLQQLGTASRRELSDESVERITSRCAEYGINVKQETENRIDVIKVQIDGVLRELDSAAFNAWLNENMDDWFE